jgi:hypothetical protein
VFFAYIYWTPLAGAALWCLFWVPLHKLGRNPACKALSENKPGQVVITEATNLLLHWITDPARILSTWGGTAVNVGFVLGCLQSRVVVSLISAKSRRSA